MKKWKWIIVILLILLAGGYLTGYYLYHEWNSQTKSNKHEALQEVRPVDQIQDHYDVIVVGTDPEGIAAAVSASRNGLQTLLIENKPRNILGGLVTLGWLNSIDMNWDQTKDKVEVNGVYEHDYFNKGIFKEWYERVGGHSFNVNNAANAFYDLVEKEPNIDLFMTAESVEPIVLKKDGASDKVTGLKVRLKDGSEKTVEASSVIDATQDADIAAASGVEFTIGREDLGDKNSRMAVTSVFRIKNVDSGVWKKMFERLDASENPAIGGMNGQTAWGYNEEMKKYKPVNYKRTAVRGLNIGLQNGDTALINAMYVFNVDGLSKSSKEEAIEIARQEAPHVVAYLKKVVPEFKNIEFDDVAPELYVRETRHMVGLYRLNIIDLLENRDQWDRIAFGSYPVDIQRTSPSDYGSVVLQPLKYAVPFRSLVPKKVDGILVVGRSASYDSLPHGSARVIPVGMAEGEAAGAAAKLIKEKGITYRELAADRSLIEELQRRLNAGGMELQPYKVRPEKFAGHKAYEGLKVAVYIGAVNGGYHNDQIDLDKASMPKRMLNLIKAAQRKYPAAFPADLRTLVPTDDDKLTLKQACSMIAAAAGIKANPQDAAQTLVNKGLLSRQTLDLIQNSSQLTDGDTYMILKDVLKTNLNQEISEKGIDF